MKKIVAILIVLCLHAFAQVSTYHWVTTDTINGNGIQNSGPIKIYGQKWRLKYTTSDKSKIFIYKTLTSDGSVFILNRKTPPAASVTTGTYSDPAEFYLTVKGHQNNWCVNVEQYLDKGLEWTYMQDRKRAPKEELIATWGGADNAVFAYEGRNEPCHLEFSLSEPGMCEVNIVDDAGRTVFHELFLKQGTVGETWLYRSGNYEITVTTNVPWMITATVPTK